MNSFVHDDILNDFDIQAVTSLSSYHSGADICLLLLLSDCLETVLSDVLTG